MPVQPTIDRKPAKRAGARMVVKPMIRNNLCLNSHPVGCAALVAEQIGYVKKTFADGTASRGQGGRPCGGGPKLVLVIGCSTGYGLASRISAAYGYNAATIGVSFEKAGSVERSGTPGWYNNLAFDTAARRDGLVAHTVDGDAFADETKHRAAEAVREAAFRADLPAQIDLVVYSLASPVRVDPFDGTLHRSVIKPIGKPYGGLAMDVATGELTTMSVESATDDEIAATVKVMGGEDWALWMDALRSEGLLAPDVKTVAYTYIGPELSWGIYRDGTIGRAKEHLEKTARELHAKLAPNGGGAWVSVNKALVTRSSAVIPIISIYISCLYKVMKEAGLHEGCIEQMVRLYRDRLYLNQPPSSAKMESATVPTDEADRIRLDDWEMRDDIQTAVSRLAERTNTFNFKDMADVAGFQRDFLQVYGFAVDGIDYETAVDPSGI